MLASLWLWPSSFWLNQARSTNRCLMVTPAASHNAGSRWHHRPGPPAGLSSEWAARPERWWACPVSPFTVKCVRCPSTQRRSWSRYVGSSWYNNCHCCIKTNYCIPNQISPVCWLFGLLSWLSHCSVTLSPFSTWAAGDTKSVWLGSPSRRSSPPIINYSPALS